MELRAENVKNIRSLALCKEFLRQAIELNDQLNEELRWRKFPDKKPKQMSELKVYHCNEWHNEYTEFYLKPEVDKLIAEKDTKIIQLEAFIDNYNRIAKEIIDNANC